MTLSSKLWMGVCAGLMSAYAVTASASAIPEVNVQFGSGYGGTGAAPDTGTTWNGDPGPTPGGYTAVKDSHNNTLATPVTISFPVPPGGDYGGGSSSGTNTLLKDYFYSKNDNPAVSVPDDFVIGGLTSGQAYDLYLYGTAGDDPNANAHGGAKFTITSPVTAPGSTIGIGNSLPASYMPSASTVPAGSPDSSYVYQKFTVVAVGGQITGTWVAPATNSSSLNQYGFFNGFQIGPVMASPEPASAGMLIVGAIGLLARKRARCV